MLKLLRRHFSSSPRCYLGSACWTWCLASEQCVIRFWQKLISGFKEWKDTLTSSETSSRNFRTFLHWCQMEWAGVKPSSSFKTNRQTTILHLLSPPFLSGDLPKYTRHSSFMKRWSNPSLPTKSVKTCCDCQSQRHQVRCDTWWLSAMPQLITHLFVVLLLFPVCSFHHQY